MMGQREPRLPVLTGRAWTFTDDLAAADILPSRFAALSSPDALADPASAPEPSIADASSPLAPSPRSSASRTLRAPAIVYSCSYSSVLILWISSMSRLR